MNPKETQKPDIVDEAIADTKKVREAMEGYALKYLTEVFKPRINSLLDNISEDETEEQFAKRLVTEEEEDDLEIPDKEEPLKDEDDNDLLDDMPIDEEPLSTEPSSMPIETSSTSKPLKVPGGTNVQIKHFDKGLEIKNEGNEEIEFDYNELSKALKEGVEIEDEDIEIDDDKSLELEEIVNLDEEICEVCGKEPCICDQIQKEEKEVVVDIDALERSQRMNRKRPLKELEVDPILDDDEENDDLELHLENNYLEDEICNIDIDEDEDKVDLELRPQTIEDIEFKDDDDDEYEYDDEDKVDKIDERIEKIIKQNKKLVQENKMLNSAINIYKENLRKSVLLNEQLMAVQRVFSATSLTRDQKKNVVKKLSETKNIREIKLVEESLRGIQKPSTKKEHLDEIKQIRHQSSASKMMKVMHEMSPLKKAIMEASGDVTKEKQILTEEVDMTPSMKSNWKQLAGIK